MADIVDFFNWTYVSTVASEGDYGEKGIEAFKDELTARNVCTAIEAKVPQSSNKQNFEKIVKELKNNEARVVALFLRVEDATQLLSAAQRLNMIDSFVWIASDGWGNNPLPVKDTTNVSRGAITIELKSKKIPDFDTYFRRRRPSNNTRNPWFNEFWESAHKCKFKPKENGSLCTGNETFPDFKQESKLQFVYDTVYAVAQALNKVLEEQCWLNDDRKTCMSEFLRDGKTFYKHYLLNVSFEGE
ncbi:unnamed protein product [Dimorphilus gyrociliatus]|uniref:Receptor ligand binding region domain-containing protein n=1 Tax=Dimorphilus gyrociliatus TaxID=2664684 RepID=A0A7I8W948_9ANNE|nr:unnamed protein product [Dimorphilus gyrociliatus]